MSAALDFPKFRRDAVHALTDLNEGINATFGITAWERFDYDLGAGTLTFSHKGKARVVADIQVIGATDVDFLWGWANAGWWPAALLEDVQKVRAWGEENGVADLVAPRLQGENLTELGWAMTAVAAKITGALGAYRPMDGPRSLFFLYRSIGFVE
ncbi:MAG: hypothetical protein Q8L23_17920 [Caulobacter sp.]|nr:hypothetical protein [Caulobacter sp.]